MRSAEIIQRAFRAYRILRLTEVIEWKDKFLSLSDVFTRRSISAIKIQRLWLKYKHVCSKHIELLHSSVVCIQRYFRTFIQRRKFRGLQVERNAMLIIRNTSRKYMLAEKKLLECVRQEEVSHAVIEIQVRQSYLDLCRLSRFS